MTTNVSYCPIFLKVSFVGLDTSVGGAQPISVPGVKAGDRLLMDMPLNSHGLFEPFVETDDVLVQAGGFNLSATNLELVYMRWPS